MQVFNPAWHDRIVVDQYDEGERQAIEDDVDWAGAHQHDQHDANRNHKARHKIADCAQAQASGGELRQCSEEQSESRPCVTIKLAQLKDRKEIYVFPFSLNPEGPNPSGSVNFSKVSHAKLSIAVEGHHQAVTNPVQSIEDLYQVDVYGTYYNWLAIKDGRALTSFA